jgi:DNA-binding NtrC family response regulator
MKGNILLVADSESDANAIIAEAAKQSGRGVRKVSSQQQAFQVLSTATDEIDLAIIDLDLGLHGLALLETLGANESDLPVIAITSQEKSEADMIAYRHGAAACVSKPFTASQLLSVIEQAFSSWKPHKLSCDLWGHPHPRRMHVSAE